MTHKFKLGDECMFDDNRNRYTRPVRVKVKELLHARTYTVQPVPCGPNLTAFEEELYLA